MRVAVDLRPLQIGHEYRGIGTYLINILSRLPHGSSHHFIFYQFDTSDPLSDHSIPRPKSYEIIRLPKPIWRKSIFGLINYVRSGLYPAFPKLAATTPDVFLQPDFQLGLPKLSGCKTIVVMYDLIPLILRSDYMPSWKQPIFDNSLRVRSRISTAAKRLFHERRYYKSLHRVESADTVLSISKSTTKDLHEHLGIDRNKIVTIPLAASFIESKSHGSIRKQITNTVSKIKHPFLAYIGGTDERRKIDALVEAFNNLNTRGHKVDLVLAGKELSEINLIPNVNARNTIINSPYGRQIHLLGYLTDAEKAYILKQATIFVYPTLYEGFGLPILEAMQVGCPVVTYTNSSIPEVGGDAIAYAPTSNADGIYSAVCPILKNPQTAKSMSRDGVAQAAMFSWDVTSKKTWQTVLN